MDKCHIGYNIVHVEYQNPNPNEIDHLNFFYNKALTIKLTSVLNKMISKINYLLLARYRTDLSFWIRPHIFTDWYIQHTTTKAKIQQIK